MRADLANLMEPKGRVSQVATLLIADEDRGLVEVLSQLAQRHDYRVVNVDNGRALLDQLAQTPAELCAIELLLPELDGLEVIPLIRRHYPDTKILAMCGGGIFGPGAAAAFLQMAQFLGAHGTLVKPFALPEFLSLVHDLFGTPQPAAFHRPQRIAL